MNALLELREKLKAFYAEYDVYIRPVLRFALAIIAYLAINNQIGYLDSLNNIFVIVILAVVSAILPLNGIVVIGMILIIAHSFGLGIAVGGFAAILYLLMILLYFRFVPKDALAIILTPVAFVFHVPVLVPISLGLIRGPISAISAVCGVLSWKFMESLPAVVEPLVNARDSSILDVIQTIPTALLSTETILIIITMVVVVLIVSAIRKLLSERSWEAGIIVGAVIYLVLMISGSYILSVELDLVNEIVGTVLSVVVGLVIQFFYYSVDYSRSEYLQFEDDKNYYYVKILPKKTPRYDDALDEPDVDEDGIPLDDSRFMETEEPSDVEKKFEGINLQSKLEESLKTLNTNQSGRENAPVENTQKLHILSEPTEIPEENIGDTKKIDDFPLPGDDSES